MKVLVVFGTRPEAIKLAPVIRELRRRSGAAAIECRVCVTGQHREMLDQVLRLFAIRPDHDLNLMTPGQTPTQVAAAVLTGLEPILAAERPDWVLVQGDTTTALAAALAAFHGGALVGHVEAGLRTGNKRRPFPEEVSRRLVGVIADLHFAPTGWARDNLLREGVSSDRVLVTGNPVIDALQWVVGRLPPDEADRAGGARTAERLILLTAHRRESFGAPLEQICLAIRDIVGRSAGRVRVVYPVHRNPQVWEPVHRLLGDVPGVDLLPPLDYEPLVRLMRRADLVLTDSGGLQEEAPSLGKPVLVLRDVTERPEAVEAGTVRVIGTDRAVIVRETLRLLDDPAAYRAMALAVSPYGDGQASGRIVQALLDCASGQWPVRSDQPPTTGHHPLR